MNTLRIDATSGYTPSQTVRVSRNVGKVEDKSSTIRFIAVAMFATTVCYIGFKVMAMAGV